MEQDQVSFLDQLVEWILSLFRGGLSGPSAPASPGGPSAPGASPVIPPPFIDPGADLRLHHRPPAPIEGIILSVSAAYGIRYDVMAKIAFVESSFRPAARNDTDSPPSVGLFGVKSSTARALMGWTDDRLTIEKRLADAAVNADVAGRLLVSIRRNQPAARSELVLVEMFHLGETRYRGGERDPDYMRRYASA